MTNPYQNIYTFEKEPFFTAERNNMKTGACQMKLAEGYSEAKRKRTVSCTSSTSAVEHFATGYCRHQG